MRNYIFCKCKSALYMWLINGGRFQFWKFIFALLIKSNIFKRKKDLLWTWWILFNSHGFWYWPLDCSFCPEAPGQGFLPTRIYGPYGLYLWSQLGNTFIKSNGFQPSWNHRSSTNGFTWLFYSTTFLIN